MAYHAKACLIEDGHPTVGLRLEVGRMHRFKKGSGLPIKASSVELVEIGAGGGKVSPDRSAGAVEGRAGSAGADPGQRYMAARNERPRSPTRISLLGYWTQLLLGGRMQLDVDAARTAVSVRLAEPLGLSIEQARWTVHQVATKTWPTRLGHTRSSAAATRATIPCLLFGGAGRCMRSSRSEARVRELIAPFAAGVASTIVCSPRRWHSTLCGPRWHAWMLDWPSIEALLQEMESNGRQLLRGGGTG